MLRDRANATTQGGGEGGISRITGAAATDY